MNKGFEVFNIDPSLQSFGLQSAIKVLTTKIPESSKKQRKVGGTTLTYIGGHTVIRLLNEAFNYQWSFEIVTEDIVQSIPKFNKYAKAGQPTHEEQPPVAKVLGRLTVPGLGVKEQYGSKVLIGGATEQESAFKSASTDAMKKCASLFGIGLELYGEDEFNFDLDEAITLSQPATPAQTYKKTNSRATSRANLHTCTTSTTSTTCTSTNTTTCIICTAASTNRFTAHWSSRMGRARHSTLERFESDYGHHRQHSARPVCS